MRVLQLYTEPPRAPVVEVPPIERDAACARCEFGKAARTVCMPAEGVPGGLLLVAEMPGREEDAAGRPFYGSSGRYLRGLVKRWWTGPIAMDNAVRCAPGKQKVQSKHITACRPFGGAILRAVRPTRIVCLGASAIQAYLGRRPAILSVRRGYGWLRDPVDDLIPVFYAVNPAAATRNRFIASQFEADLEWALTCPVPATPWLEYETALVENAADAAVAEGALRGTAYATYDVETHGQMHNPDFRLESVTLLGELNHRAYTWTRSALRDKQARAILRRLLEGHELATQNGKYDDRAVRLDLGAQPQKIRCDTRLMRRMLDPESNADLATLAELVGMGGHKAEMEDSLDRIEKELKYQANPPVGLTPLGKPRKVRPPAFHVPSNTLDQVRAGVEPAAFSMAFVEEELLYRYNARDVFSTRDLARDRLLPDFEQEKSIQRMWNTVVRDQNRAVREIEHWGFAVNRTAVETTRAYLLGQIETASKQVYALAGRELNLDSPVQLGELLFKQLGLPITHETDSGAASTGKDALEGLAGKHPLIAPLLAYRKHNTLAKFTAGWLAEIRADGRIHASFLPDGAGSGRMSSAGPNLQNVPSSDRDPVLGKMMRDCFVAEPGNVLLEFDYSQLELRVAAMLSGDAAMIADFKAGIDIHSNNARALAPIIWGIDLATWDSWDEKQRKPYRAKIKTTTFGKLYGKSDAALAREFGCKVREVEEINERIWGKYKQLDRWTQERLRESRRSGEAWTWWAGQRGHRRPLHRIADHEKNTRENAERSSWNTPIQGTAAHFMNASLWPIIDWIRSEGLPAKVVATVHDSVVFELRESVLMEVAEGARRILTGWDSMGVPIVVDGKAGPSWGSLKALPGGH